ncbi:MAG TPA: glycosyltransferase [Candidatus Saccharimonadales bacterium]|nr:glycosyltransferase [Candidatus Saccharimonadales bacterium]
MISFVWSSKYPFIAGSGGSETYTAGQIRELQRRGIATRIITLGHGEKDGRDDFPDIPFLALKSKEQLANLDDTLVYITYPLKVKTKRQAYAILHCPPPNFAHGDPLYNRESFKGVKLITASRFAAGLWRRWLHKGLMRMGTVHPHADEAFSKVVRPKAKANRARVLFAGRLKADKGIYTLLAALHMEDLEEVPFDLTVTTAGSNTDEGKAILKMLHANPEVNVMPARRNPQEMAKLLANYDVLVMPSTNIFWQELFGMLSIEAQHAGCRVVASRAGGLPETNLGGAVFVKPDDPKALAAGLAKAIGLGPLTAEERQAATSRFTVAQSVDKLLKVIDYKGESEAIPEHTISLREAGELLSQVKPQLVQIADRSKRSAYLGERLVQK